MSRGLEEERKTASDLRKEDALASHKTSLPFFQRGEKENLDAFGNVWTGRGGTRKDLSAKRSDRAFLLKATATFLPSNQTHKDTA